ncbi:MAG TPA: hypothetical protein DCP71_01530 [Verrucomicrobiales bacterium]|jgi:hypothetical protein|nr:hypothetical protein [Verrucomicrobiales bacterium]
MKTLLVLVLFTLSWNSLSAEAVGLELAGVKYELASVQTGKDGSVTNEYVPLGETIDSWTTLLGVRHWPKAAKIGDAAGPWLKMVQPLLTQKVGVYKSPVAKSGNDIVMEAWLSAPDRSYIEINLHRFVIEEGTQGVKAYQFAQKIKMTDGKGDPAAFTKKRDALFDDLAKLSLPLHKEKR